MLHALVAVAAWVQTQDRAEKFFERVTFERAEPKNEAERRILQELKRKEHWKDAYRAIEEKLAPFPDSVSITVKFDLTGEAPSSSALEGKTQGIVMFNLFILDELQQKADLAARRKAEEEKKGLKVVYHIPPLRFERLIWRELARVFQRPYDAPDWFLYGMSCWLSEDPNYMSGFVHHRKKVEPIEKPFEELGDVAGRGQLFWKWLESRGVVRKVVEASVVKRGDWQKSIEDATGLAWKKAVAEEREWSAREAEKLKQGPKK